MCYQISYIQGCRHVLDAEWLSCEAWEKELEAIHSRGSLDGLKKCRATYHIKDYISFPERCWRCRVILARRHRSAAACYAFEPRKLNIPPNDVYNKQRWIDYLAYGNYSETLDDEDILTADENNEVDGDEEGVGDQDPSEDGSNYDDYSDATGEDNDDYNGGEEEEEEEDDNDDNDDDNQESEEEEGDGDESCNENSDDYPDETDSKCEHEDDNAGEYDEDEEHDSEYTEEIEINGSGAGCIGNHNAGIDDPGFREVNLYEETIKFQYSRSDSKSDEGYGESEQNRKYTNGLVDEYELEGIDYGYESSDEDDGQITPSQLDPLRSEEEKSYCHHSNEANDLQAQDTREATDSWIDGILEWLSRIEIEPHCHIEAANFSESKTNEYTGATTDYGYYDYDYGDGENYPALDVEAQECQFQQFDDSGFTEGYYSEDIEPSGYHYNYCENDFYYERDAHDGGYDADYCSDEGGDDDCYDYSDWGSTY